MSQNNLNGYRWPRMDGQVNHASARSQRNFYWNQRNDAALGDDRYVNYTAQEDIQGSLDPDGIEEDRRSFSAIGQHSGVGPKNYRKSDARLLEDVCETLMRSDEVDAREIQVYVVDGVVTLRGTVTDRRMKRDAEAEVDRVKGVIDVMNELRIQ